MRTCGSRSRGSALATGWARTAHKIRQQLILNIVIDFSLTELLIFLRAKPFSVARENVELMHDSAVPNTCALEYQNEKRQRGEM